MAATSDSFSEFDFRGTPAEAAAMREALSAHIERGDVKIIIALGGDLDPLEVAQTVRVSKQSPKHAEACALVSKWTQKSEA
ncbi:hypothetical protein G6O69_16810 [Pseudenhygromyxa sp. WMMC2535]|uniref:hypothetical protein n=1 Tax=Pseudenhygromyxa sp. WMMC2535 TaxID=2712867 RepID=UPI001553A2FF|nr:hypothetical protein [Pseudenhygromyxa sp. WMMC2535]NVB39505.1 hypothetical protein [Pseudenhygromyxa sp. WMMC2535]